MIGKRFGRLTILSGTLGPKGSYVKVTAKCDCGKTIKTRGYSVRSGTTKSCGCLSRDTAIATHTKHGMSKSREFRTWHHMRQRCRDKNSHEFHNYGGRGIKVCARWDNSFINFFKDMGPQLQGFSIDRIDNDGDYRPGNCRWATRAEQRRNQRGNNWIKFDGKKLVLTDWAKLKNLEPTTLSGRLRSGWSIKDALETPAKPTKRLRLKLNGTVISLSDISKLCGVKYATLYARLNSGWSLKDAMGRPTDIRPWRRSGFNKSSHRKQRQISESQQTE